MAAVPHVIYKYYQNQLLGLVGRVLSLALFIEMSSLSLGEGFVLFFNLPRETQISR